MQKKGGNLKQLERTLKNQERIKGRHISNSFESEIWERVFPQLPEGVSKVQVSVNRETSKFNISPYIAIK